MKNKKYYTPDLTEFHVGFEFEYRNPHTEWSKGNWDDLPIKNRELDEFGDDEIMKTAHSICRVKYLDAEDLKELGFQITMEEERPYGYYFAGKKKYTEREKIKSVGIPADVRSIEVTCSHVKTNDEYIYLKIRDSHFKGHMEFRVRSKNDLKQILKLIGC